MKTKKNPNQIQQGDVLALKLAAMPGGKQKVLARGRCILAHGESGHSHVIDDDEAELIQIGEKMLLKLGRNASLYHEEHHAQDWEAGIYEIGRVVEKDWLSGMVSPVQD